MDSLAMLRDIHLPPTPDFWPPAPGWWLLAVLVAAALALGLRVWVRRRRERRHQARRRRRPLVVLQALRADYTRGAQAATVVYAVSTLLRQTALVHHPRLEVASLHGNAWLEFLDRSGEPRHRQALAGEAGRLLAEGPFKPETELAQTTHESMAALLDLAEDWIRAQIEPRAQPSKHLHHA